jgi:glycerophosphoryl diester phosphodiesterase
MIIRQSTRAVWRNVGRVACALLAALVSAYLVLVWLGGGWSPRHNERLAWESNRVLLFAHRGVTLEAPENSEAAFDAAYRLGFPGIELDIRKTRDNQLALSHDVTADKMLGLHTRFDALTLAEIKAHGLLFNGLQTSNRVPTLREVFERYGATFRFYLDMKNKGFGDADQLARLIQEFGLEDRTVVASVDPLFVAYMEHYYPRINTVLERFDAAQVWLYRLMPRRWKPDFLAGFARKVTPGHAEWLQRNQLLSARIVYDVTPANYPDMLRFGIAKAIVDYVPGVFSTALSQPPSLPAPRAGKSAL